MLCMLNVNVALVSCTGQEDLVHGAQEHLKAISDANLDENCQLLIMSEWVLLQTDQVRLGQ